MMQNEMAEGIGINPDTKKFDMALYKRRDYDVIHPIYGHTTMRINRKKPKFDIPITTFYGFKLRQTVIDQLTAAPLTNKNQKRITANISRDQVRDALKNPHYDESERHVYEFLIHRTVQQFDMDFKIKTYDTIITMPSSSSLNSLLIEEFKKYAKPDVFITTDAFVKLLGKDVTIDYDMVNSEDSTKTLPALQKALKTINVKHANKPFTIKKILSNFRRYFKFLRFTDPETQEIVKSYVENKKVLLIDDTIGEGATFDNAIDHIAPFGPKSIDCFAVVKDY